MTLRCPSRVGQAVQQPDGSWRTPRCGSADIVVVSRKCNHSAFNGYRETPSRYSGVRCRKCGWPWRTKADVSDLPDASE